MKGSIDIEFALRDASRGMRMRKTSKNSSSARQDDAKFEGSLSFVAGRAGAAVSIQLRRSIFGQADDPGTGESCKRGAARRER
jgi:hypothetical protein